MELRIDQRREADYILLLALVSKYIIAIATTIATATVRATVTATVTATAIATFEISRSIGEKEKNEPLRPR